MGSRDEYPKSQGSPSLEEIVKLPDIMCCQGRESRQRRSGVAVERRRNTPHSAVPIAKFLLLLLCIFNQAIWRVSNDCMNAVLGLCVQPCEAVSLVENRALEVEYRLPSFHSLQRWCRKEAVVPSCFPKKNFIGV